MLLDETRAIDLAKGVASMVDSIQEFFEEPNIKQKYQEWHLKKYGYLPDEQEAI